MIITIKHMRASKMCRKGAKKWFADNGLDWDKFRTQGLEEDLILKTNDAMAEKVVRVAHGRR